MHPLTGLPSHWEAVAGGSACSWHWKKRREKMGGVRWVQGNFSAQFLEARLGVSEWDGSCSHQGKKKNSKDRTATMDKQWKETVNPSNEKPTNTLRIHFTLPAPGSSFCLLSNFFLIGQGFILAHKFFFFDTYIYYEMIITIRLIIMCIYLPPLEHPAWASPPPPLLPTPSKSSQSTSWLSSFGSSENYITGLGGRTLSI